MKYLIGLTLILTSCAGSRTVAPPEQKLFLDQSVPQPTPLPRAQIYKMTGDATAANVPVQVNADGKIISFPAPSDLVGQEPIALKDGWYLDRRGIGGNTRFTTYTYADYSKLKVPPSIAELQAAIIPDARVIDLRKLPMSPQEAEADTAALTQYLK